MADHLGKMEKTLPHPLEAEIIDQNGQLARAVLVAYAGKNRWRATLDGGREIVVDAAHIVSIAARQDAD